MDFIDTFEKLCLKHPGQVPYSAKFSAPESGPHLLFTFGIHGDEIGSIPAAIKILNQLSEQKMKLLKGEVVFALGNIAAIKQNKRFIKNDINRMFKPNTPIPNCEEGRRGKEIKSLILNSNIHIDFHQTIQETKEPFFLGIANEENLKLAQTAGTCHFFVETGLELSQKFGALEVIAHTAKCQHIVIELSQKGLNEQAEKNCLKAMINTIDGYLNNKINQMNPLKRLKLIYEEPFNNSYKALKKGMVNLSRVKRNDVLGLASQNADLICPKDGYIFFPKYPERDSDGKIINEAPLALFELAVEVD